MQVMDWEIYIWNYFIPLDWKTFVFENNGYMYISKASQIMIFIYIVYSCCVSGVVMYPPHCITGLSLV